MAYVCLLSFSFVLANRNPKFSIFQIIKFENAVCVGSTRNGTCFTDSECEAKGGTDDGSCADGFGVCCIKIIDASGSTALNNSYIVETSATVTAGSSKSYTVCPVKEDICRIRFDFTVFILSPPFTDPGTLPTATPGTADQGAPIGDCVEDQFSITSPVSSGTPVICGTNTGQHMILDSDGVGCSNVNFAIGSAVFARSWDIKVMQFNCGDEMGGPAGCLQWFTENTGTIRSFNFPNQAAGAAVAAGVVHLSNQHYKACIRRPLGANRICYPPCTSVNPANGQSSFGVSRSDNANANSQQAGQCADDFIGIPGGIASKAASAGDLSLVSVFCGRELLPAADTDWANANGGNAIDATTAVCTSVAPFEITVHFDDNEVFDNANNANDARNEWSINPGGIIGFSLCYETA